MGWVKDRLEQQSKAAVPQVNVKPSSPPKWLPVWKQTVEVIKNDVLEFNEAPGNQCKVLEDDYSLTLIKEVPITTAAIQADQKTGSIHVMCPPAGQGIGRHGNFEIKGGHISVVGNFVGYPQPPATPMKPEEFSRHILEPFFFP
jgi:hypothetical protein